MAFVDTRHYDWCGFGETKEEALKALRKAWNASDADKAYFREMVAGGEIEYFEFYPGQGFMDHQLMTDNPRGEQEE